MRLQKLMTLPNVLLPAGMSREITFVCWSSGNESFQLNVQPRVLICWPNKSSWSRNTFCAPPRPRFGIMRIKFLIELVLLYL